MGAESKDANGEDEEDKVAGKVKDGRGVNEEGVEGGDEAAVGAEVADGVQAVRMWRVGGRLVLSRRINAEKRTHAFARLPILRMMT